MVLETYLSDYFFKTKLRTKSSDSTSFSILRLKILGYGDRGKIKRKNHRWKPSLVALEHYYTNKQNYFYQ